MKSDLFEINLPGNRFSSHSIAILDVCAGAPSCMKIVWLLASSESSGKVSINIVVYRSFVTVSAEPVSESLKKDGPKRPSSMSDWPIRISD